MTTTQTTYPIREAVLNAIGNGVIYHPQTNKLKLVGSNHIAPRINPLRQHGEH